MLRVTVETDSGESYKFEFDGEAAQFKDLWERAEAGAVRQEAPPLGLAAIITNWIAAGKPAENPYEEWGRNAWVAYAVLSEMSDHLRCSYPMVFEIVARETIIVTIRRGAAAKTFSIKIDGYPALDS